MNIYIISIILTSVALSVLAQILLKLGMTHPLVQTHLKTTILPAAYAILTNPFVLGGMAAYVAGAVFWLIVLARVEVSRAYPFVGLGFIGTMLFAYFFLNEPITLNKFMGTLLVVAGIILISR
ncbi:MAG TPA: small multi-drug resistant family protein [Desulfobacteraceae bacterium]|nr:small multi-drug resistant family protein [Desulfobacteraceae bacterium]